MALYGNTCLKGSMTFRTPVQPDSSGAICSRSLDGWLQKQRVGEPYLSMFRTVFRIPPCEGPQERLSGRRRGAWLRIDEVCPARDTTVPPR